MTVPLSKRSISDYEFYNTALGLRDKITKWLLRDFGVKPHDRNLDDIGRRFRMNEDDKKVLSDLLSKYGMGQQICETYPEWWINERRGTIDKICADLILNIVKAYEIYPQTSAEYDERRKLQDTAITLVYALLSEVRYVATILFKQAGMNMNLCADIAEMCSKEIALLKGWRKDGNKIQKAILKKEAENRLKVEKQLRERNPEANSEISIGAFLL